MHQNSFKALARLLGWGEKCIYTLGEVARVSEARFVWLYTTGQGRGSGRCFIYIYSGAGEWRVEGGGRTTLDDLIRSDKE